MKIRSRVQDSALAVTAGMAGGFVFAVVRSVFFRDTFSMLLNEVRPLSAGEHFVLALYLVCAYVTLGAVAGVVLGGLYSASVCHGERVAMRKVVFWQFLLWAVILLRLLLWLNLDKFLLDWGAKVVIGGRLVRVALLSPRVWAENAVVAAFALGGFLVSCRIFKGMLAGHRWMTSGTRALLLAWIVSLGGYFSVVVEINYHLPPLLSPPSIVLNVLLAAGFLLMGMAVYLFTRRRLERSGFYGMERAFVHSPKARLILGCVLCVCLAGLGQLFIFERNIPLKFMLYRQSHKVLRSSLSALDSLLDFDRDGYSGVSILKDPYPFDARRGPMAIDYPLNGIDEDGVGGDSRDADGDGFARGIDCDDGNARVYPGALELPNGRDDDCDGIADNPAPGLFPLERDPRIARARELSAENRLLVLIICADSLRADHVGFMGYGRDTTPALDELARRSVVFTRAYAPATGTAASVPSLFLSVYPGEHRVKYFDFLGTTSDKEIRPLTDGLRACGYYTAFLASHYSTDTLRERAALGRGFDIWRDAEYFNTTQVDAPRMREEFSRMVTSAPAGNALFYIHFWEPHFMRAELPSPYREKFGDLPGETNFISPSKEDFDYMKLHYDRRVAFFDSEMKKLVDYLKKTGRWDTTLIFVTADHGEEYGEHGGLFHLVSLYEEAVHVPLLIRFPGQEEERLVTQPVQLMDIMPTVLAVAGIEPPPYTSGKSLLPLVARADAGPLHEFVFIENTHLKTLYRLGLVHGRYKYIADLYTGEDFLFDLERDPGEMSNLTGELPELRERLRRVLFDHRSAAERRYREYPEREGGSE